tara:strand:- start:98 stop:493 length:396 start_codon:yes stop_codon:yes gene_type:complete
MKYELPDVLPILRPGAEWEARATREDGYLYSNLVWLDNKTSKPTEIEINNKIADMDDAEPGRQLREARNILLAESDWVVVKAQETGTEIPKEWKEYRQALRDLPYTANPKLDDSYYLDPTSFTMPTKPSLD